MFTSASRHWMLQFIVISLRAVLPLTYRIHESTHLASYLCYIFSTTLGLFSPSLLHPSLILSNSFSFPALPPPLLPPSCRRCYGESPRYPSTQNLIASCAFDRDLQTFSISSHLLFLIPFLSLWWSLQTWESPACLLNLYLEFWT